MSATATVRRRVGQRISSALWGVLVAGVGGLMIAAYSGYEIDLELATIVVLAAIGGWLLISAAVSGIGRKREISRATAPTVEERVEPENAGAEAEDTPTGDRESEPEVDSAGDAATEDRDVETAAQDNPRE